MKRFITLAIVVMLVLSALALTGCDEQVDNSSATTKEAAIVNSQDSVYAKGQPIPRFDYSIPRDLFTQFYKFQTQEGINTYSVVSDINGNVYYEGPTMGYPIPYNSQLTNPEKTEVHEGNYNGGNVTLPQSEPNGLYTSPTTNATIVMFIDPATGKLMPVYTELNVTCFPFTVKKTATTSTVYQKSGSPTALLAPKGKTTK